MGLWVGGVCLVVVVVGGVVFDCGFVLVGDWDFGGNYCVWCVGIVV